MTYKNIRIPKRGGGTRLQRVKVLASGKYKFVKNLGKSRKSTKTRASNPKPKRSVRKTAKRKRRRSRSMTIPLAPTVGLISGFATPDTSGNSAIKYFMAGNIGAGLSVLSKHYTGFDPGYGVFRFDDLKKGLMPLVIGILVHKFVGGSPLNVNKVLARAKVPFIRI